MQKRRTGVQAALLSAALLGLAPVFGKQAVLLGIKPLAIVGFRTLLAALLLLLILTIFSRQYLFIYPAGLIGCGLAGLLNGIGSLFYFAALGRINASLGQLFYSLYPLFVAIVLVLDSQPPSRLTMFRISLAMVAVVFLTFTSTEKVDIVGVGQMLLGALFYAIHLPVNQRVLYDVPAPTVTLYTLIAMSIVVFPAFLIFEHTLPATGTWWPVLGLTVATFTSRLLLFLGVKHLGGMDTALLGLLELLVTIGLSHIWLHESLSFMQWIGAAILILSTLLVYFEKPPSNRTPHHGGWLSWLRPPSLPPDVH